jgi:hypothetical protein
MKGLYATAINLTMCLLIFRFSVAFAQVSPQIYYSSGSYSKQNTESEVVQLLESDQSGLIERMNNYNYVISDITNTIRFVDKLKPFVDYVDGLKSMQIPMI